MPASQPAQTVHPRIGHGLWLAGSPAARDAIVYVHGFNSSAKRWNRLARAVAAVQPDVAQLAFNYPSNWHSIWVFRPFEREARLFRDWLTEYAGSYTRILIVAHSVGCIIAREALVQQAEEQSTGAERFSHCFFITPPFRGIHVKGVEAMIGTVLPRAGVFYRVAYGVARVMMGAVRPLSVKARELSYNSAYLVGLQQRSTNVGFALCDATFVFADYDALIGGGYLRRTQGDDVHSTAAWHPAAGWNMIPRDHEPASGNSTMAQAIASAVQHARGTVLEHRCLFCKLNSLFELSADAGADIRQLENIMMRIDALLVDYPDNHDLTELRTHIAGRIGVLS